MFHLHIALHHTLYSGNIGSVARAMGNMGAKRLILIDPQCEINSEAKRSAVGCQDFLNQRTVYSNWDEFYKNEGEGLRVAFTARGGKLRPAIEAEELFSDIHEKYHQKTSTQNIYLIFGREDSGLSSEDVELCHHACTLQTFGDYTSLNLAQAVLIALYTAQKKLCPEAQIQTHSIGKESPVSPAFFPKESIREWLLALGLDLSAKRINAYKVLSQLILRNEPSSKELRILEIVLKQTVRKLKETRHQKVST